MPICTVCEEEVEEVTKCTMCGLTFCAECGNPDVKLCTYCLDDDKDHHDYDDDFNTNENWYEKQQLVEQYYRDDYQE